MKDRLEKAFPNLIWDYMCEERPEMVGTGHRYRVDIDTLGETLFWVCVGIHGVGIGTFSHSGTYTAAGPVDAINKAIDGAVDKAGRCKTFLLTKKSLDRGKTGD